MDDEFYPRHFQPLPREPAPAPAGKDYSKWIVGFAIAIGICVIVLVVLMFSYFSKGSVQNETLANGTAGSQMRPVMQLDDNTFLYNGQVVLGGKAYNVSLRIDGVTMEDAVRIVKAYEGG